jgi:hypothetical protein
MVLPVVLQLLTICGIAAQIYDVLKKQGGNASAVASTNVHLDSGARRDALALMDTVLRTTIATVFGSSAADELKKVNVKLGEITDVLSIQASFGDSFPQHVYDFAKMEIERTTNTKVRDVADCIYQNGREKYDLKEGSGCRYWM